ncbi:MAG: hypothetical protein WCT77_00320 [Bacteroidota bacterium]|jgi:hypothetical protein
MNGLDGGKFFSGTGNTVITDATVISNITNPANWNGSGNYTGSTTGLVNGNVYFDTATKLRYEYLNSTLTRINYNTEF